MKLPSPPSLRGDDFPEMPDWGKRLLGILSKAFSDLFDAVSTVPELGEGVDLTFTSAASGSSSAEVGFSTSARPRHVQVTMLRRDDDVELTAAWSFTWVLAASTIKLSFQGLPASVKCRFSVEYR